MNHTSTASLFSLLQVCHVESETSEVTLNCESVVRRVTLRKRNVKMHVRGLNNKICECNSIAFGCAFDVTWLKRGFSWPFIEAKNVEFVIVRSFSKMFSISEIRSGAKVNTKSKKVVHSSTRKKTTHWNELKNVADDQTPSFSWFSSLKCFFYLTIVKLQTFFSVVRLVVCFFTLLSSSTFIFRCLLFISRFLSCRNSHGFHTHTSDHKLFCVHNTNVFADNSINFDAFVHLLHVHTHLTFE